MKKTPEKIVRLLKDGKVSWGILEDDMLFNLDGDLFGSFQRGKKLCRLAEVKLLAPAEPSIMVCCGMNYRKRFEEKDYKEAGWTPTEEPILFFKPASALIGHMDEVVFPTIAETLRYEAELCVVIKKTARNISEREVPGYILGYTCGNELGAVDLLKKDKWLTRAKGFDTFAPLGPCLVIGLDHHDLRITSKVNGELKQDSRTSLMTFSVEYLISYISAFMTLRPGDVIWTGTPEGVGFVNLGDVMEVEIEGIGTIRNKVVAPK